MKINKRKIGNTNIEVTELGMGTAPIGGWPIEVNENDVKKYSKIIQDEMSSVKDSDLHSFSIPLLVDVNVGNNWGDLH